MPTPRVCAPSVVYKCGTRAEGVLRQDRVNVKAVLGHVRLDAIKPEDLHALMSARREAGMAVTTIIRDLATLRRVLNLAVDWGVIASARRVRLLPGEKRRERVVNESEEAKYLAVAAPLLKAVATIMLDCALRPEGVHRLRWSENVRDGAIEIHVGKGSGSRRCVTVTERVASVLAEQDRLDDFVFSAGTKSGHIEQSTYRDLHERAVLDTGVERFVPYDLRHTSITRWANTGMPPHVLQKLAGHRNIATTMRYIHLAETDAQEWLDRAPKVQGGDKIVTVASR